MRQVTTLHGQMALLQAAIFAAAALLLLGLWNAEEHAENYTWPLCAFFTLHLAWFFCSWYALTGRWLDVYTVFFLSLCCFNGGELVLETFGLNEAGLFASVFSAETTNRTILLVNATVTAYHLAGVTLSRRSASPASSLGRPQGQESSISAPTARTLGFLMVAISAPAVLYRMTTAVELVAANGYFALYQREIRTGVDNWQGILNTFFLPGILITLAMCRNSRGTVVLCWGLMSGYALANLFIGLRTNVMTACIPVVLLHHNLVGRIRSTYLIGGGVLMLAVFTFVAQTRNGSLSERYAAGDIGTTESPLVAAVREMGGSATTIGYTLELVPATREFDCGASYGYALLTAVPNFFWSLHPSLQWGSYADWLVRIVDPDFADARGGLGYSVIAEAYANFSLLGPPLVGLFSGLGLAALVRWVRGTRDPFSVALEMIVLSAVLLLPRSETMAMCRTLIWFGLIPYILVRRQAGRTANEKGRGISLPFGNRNPCPKRCAS